MHFNFFFVKLMPLFLQGFCILATISLDKLATL
ncbi:hypothetical protein Meth11DRAFT_0664 [Methylophilaceae bacterium 11]|nr:hypothetical protein Meth11DRAFT_0664 [Methylophilaceae bacterium 11]